MAGLVAVTRDGTCRRVTLRDPQHNNALSVAMVRELTEAVQSVTEGVLLVEGKGKHFCSGGEHHELARFSNEEMRAFVKSVTELFDTLLRAPVPTLVGIQGAAVGGGLELALRCDFVVAADDARVHLPQVSLNGRIGETTTALLLARTSLGRVRDLVLRGHPLAAKAALEAGLVDLVVPRAELAPACLDLAHELGAQPAQAMRRARETVNRVSLDTRASVGVTPGRRTS